MQESIEQISNFFFLCACHKDDRKLLWRFLIKGNLGKYNFANIVINFMYNHTQSKIPTMYTVSLGELKTWNVMLSLIIGERGNK